MRSVLLIFLFLIINGGAVKLQARSKGLFQLSALSQNATAGSDRFQQQEDLDKKQQDLDKLFYKYSFKQEKKEPVKHTAMVDDQEVKKHDKIQAELESQLFSLDQFKETNESPQVKVNINSEKIDLQQQELDKKFEEMINKPYRFKQIENNYIVTKNGFRFKQSPKKAKKVAPKPNEAMESSLDKTQEDLDKQFLRLSFKQVNKDQELQKKYNEKLEVEQQKKAHQKEEYQQHRKEFLEAEAQKLEKKKQKEAERKAKIEAKQKEMRQKALNEAELQKEAKEKKEHDQQLAMIKKMNERSERAEEKEESQLQSAHPSVHKQAVHHNTESVKKIDLDEEQLSKEFDRIMEKTKFKKMRFNQKRHIKHSKINNQETRSLENQFYRLTKFKQVPASKKLTSKNQEQQMITMADLEVTPQEEALDREFNKIIDSQKIRKLRFKQKTPKVVKTLLFEDQKLEHNMDDLDISKEEQDLSKKFNDIMMKQDRK